MLTAMDDDLDQAEGLDVGADDYLAKPFAYPVLLARLRALGVRSAQGYVFAPPLPGSSFLQLVEAIDPLQPAATDSTANAGERLSAASA